MGKWIRETDCEGKSVTYKCDACGFDDGWHDYKLCPMCGDKKEIEPDDDGIEWPKDLKVLCLKIDCIHSDGTGICKIQNELTENDIYGIKCNRYTKEVNNGKN